MTQLFTLSIDGELQEGISPTISKSINRFYNVATFSLDWEPLPKQEVIINYGDESFKGFVYAVRKTARKLWTVECRTNTAKLTEPFSSNDNTFEAAVTSYELCDLYEQETGIQIINTCQDLDFGGSYERSGTYLTALANIASVSGAEYWEDNNVIHIAPNKPIDSDGVLLSDGEYFDFEESSKSVYNKGVGVVIVRNGGSTSDDILSKNIINAEIDECTGNTFIYPNPIGEIEEAKGIHIREGVLKKHIVEEESVTDQSVLVLKAAIHSVSAVKLNGITVTDYEFAQGHNIIMFLTPQRGTLSVHYEGYYYSASPVIQSLPMGRFMTFDLFYLDQVLIFQGFLLDNCGEDGGGGISTNGHMTCITPDEMMYPKGFDVWTIGGRPDFRFFDKGVEILRNVTSTQGMYVSIEEANLESVTGGTYRYRTNYVIDNALAARSYGSDVPYTISNDGDDWYFEFSDYYPHIKVSYETPALKTHVQFPNISDGEIVMVIADLDTFDVCEYDLTGNDIDKTTGIPCELPASVPINIAQEIGMPVADIMGRTVTWSGIATGSAQVDAMGMIHIYVTQNGDVEIDTSGLKARTKLVLRVNV